MLGRNAVFLSAIAAVSLSGCLDFVDDIKAVASGCGPTTTETKRVEGESAMELAGNGEGREGARAYSWDLHAFGACSKAHAKAAATLILSSPIAGDARCEGATVTPADGRVFVSVGFQGYPLKWNAGQHDPGLASVYEARNNDIGLAQAFKEDEPASYLVSIGVVYSGPGWTSPNIAGACVASVLGSLTLEATYATFESGSEGSSS